MCIHTVMTRIAVAGGRPELIPEAEDGPLTDAIERVLDQLDDPDGTIFVHIWFGEIRPAIKDVFRFVGSCTDCLTALRKELPDAVAKAIANNNNNNVHSIENNSKEMHTNHSINGYEPLDSIAT